MERIRESVSLFFTWLLFNKLSVFIYLYVFSLGLFFDAFALSSTIDVLLKKNVNTVCFWVDVIHVIPLFTFFKMIIF